MAFEKWIIPEDSAYEQNNMSIHLFVAILSEYLQGQKTANEARTAIEDHIGETLTANEAQDITDTITYINGGADTFAKRNRLDEVYRVMILGAGDTWYNTQALMRARLNWSTP